MRRHAKAPSAGTSFGIGRSIGLLALVIAAFMGLTAAPAFAGYQEVGTFASNPFDERPALAGAGTADGYLFNPGQADVNDATGKLYVADTDNDRVEVFKPNETGGEYDSKVAITAPTGLAIDQATGDVYVANATGIVKYDSALNPIVVGWTDPGVSGILAVDPTNGDLLVADRGANLVRRFDSDGTALGGFAAERPLDVAVRSSGEILVVTSTGDLIDNCGATSALRRFSSAGALEGTIAGLEVPGAVEVGPGNSILVATHVASYNCGGTLPTVVVLDADGIELQSSELANNYATVSTLAEGASRLYAITKSPKSDSFGRTKIYAFAYSATPAALIDPVDLGGVTATTATLSGTVNPNGFATSYRFEYSVDGGSTWNSTATEDAGSGEAKVPVSAELTGLAPGATYQARLVAENSEGSFASQPVTFATDHSAPIAQTLPPVQVTDTSARLRAAIDPASEPTTYYFEYGTSESYGSSVPAAHNGYAGKALGAVKVVQALGDLQSGTTYHYRVVAHNATGTSFGEDLAFTTSPKPAACPNEAIRQAQRSTFLPECRAYEQVTPVDKNGASMYPAIQSGGTDDIPSSVRISRSGDAVSYRITGPLPNAPSAPVLTLAASSRGADWTSRPLGVPQLRPAPFFTADVFATSPDQRTAVVFSEVALAPGAVEGDANYYLLDVLSGRYSLIVTFPASGLGAAEVNGVLAVSNGGTHVVFLENRALTPEAVETAPSGDMNLYEYANGQLRLVNDPAAGSRRLVDNRLRILSDDGSRLLFMQGAGLYLSEDGGPGVPLGVDGTLLGASFDGNVVYLVSGGDLYRYDVEADELVDLTPGSGSVAVRWMDEFESVSPVSRDGSFVYFRAQAKLTEDAVEGSANLYVEHGGETRLIATVPEGGSMSAQWSLSPDGTNLAFASRARIGDYDNADLAGRCGVAPPLGCLEVYLYDWDTDQLTCASCPEAGSGAPAGFASLGGVNKLVTTGTEETYPASVTNQGTVFFDSPERLVAEDINGQKDVYGYRDGSAFLISSGHSPSESRFLGISEDGSNVFFSTAEQLVGQDRDSAVDLYDAPVDGGIAAQQPAPERPACSGADCRERSSAPPPPLVAASRDVQASGKAKPRRPRCAKAHRKAKRAQARRQGKKAAGKSRQVKACRGGKR